MVAEHHLVGGLEAEVLIERSAWLGCVQGDDADVAAAGLFHGAIEQHAADTLATKLRVDVEVQEIAADGAGVLEGWSEVHEHEAGTGDDAVLGHGQPAEVFMVLELSCNPRPEVFDYGVEEIVIGAAHVDEHAAALVGEEIDVIDGDRARGEHSSF